MLSQQGCHARRQRLWDAVPVNCQWLLIADPRHVHYLCNFWVEPVSFSGGERGLLLLERDGPATLLGENFTLGKAAGQPHVDEEISERWYDHRHSVINRDAALGAALGRVADRLSGRPGLVEEEHMPIALCRAAGLDPSTPQSLELGTILRGLRRRKEADEIELLKQCMRATEAGHRRAFEVVAPGVSELELYVEIQRAAQQTAGRAAIVYGDFRANQAAMPKTGGLPTEYKLQPGDLFLLDYSVVLDGYRSDFTNAIAVGEPTPAQQDLFDACCAAIEAGESSLAAGAAASRVYASVSSALEAAGHGPLGHHAGHGIGLAHPEPPILVPESDDVLVAGDVITLEPGVYVDGVGGIRLEHNYLITDDHFERLSHHKLSLT